MPSAFIYGALKGTSSILLDVSYSQYSIVCFIELVTSKYILGITLIFKYLTLKKYNKNILQKNYNKKFIKKL